MKSYNKVVYVCSPLSGDIGGNIERAKKCCKVIVDKGHIPFAPHVLFTQFLDDNDPEIRSIALKMDMEMLKRVDMLVVFNDMGISKGMLQEIEEAKKLGLPVIYCSDDGLEKARDTF